MIEKLANIHGQGSIHLSTKINEIIDWINKHSITSWCNNPKCLNCSNQSPKIATFGGSMIGSISPESPPFSCNICKRTFLEWKDFEIHKTKHKEE